MGAQPDASARDLRFFGQLLPDGLPDRHLEPEFLAQARHLGGERLAYFVVVARLETVAPIERVLRRARAAEDVHRADVPLGERRLGLVTRGGILGELLDPVFAVADVELLFFEDTVDRAHPRAIGAAPHVLELMPRA